MHWGDMQSVLQITVGLNVAYFSFREIRAPAFVRYAKEFESVEREVSETKSLESTIARSLERWRRRRAFARLQKCSLCGRRDWDRESTRVFCHPPNHRVHARQFRSQSRSLQPSFVHSEPGGAAPTIKRNAAKEPLISGRHPDMTTPSEVSYSNRQHVGNDSCRGPAIPFSSRNTVAQGWNK
jgi:hypothetical protein